MKLGLKVSEFIFLTLNRRPLAGVAAKSRRARPVGRPVCVLLSGRRPSAGPAGGVSHAVENRRGIRGKF